MREEIIFQVLSKLNSGYNTHVKNLTKHSSPFNKMVAPLSQRIIEQVPGAATLYYRLILVTGPPRTGKTTALRELHADKSWPMVNVNLTLSERLLELTTRQRALKVSELLEKLAKEHEGDVLLLDNTEVLFSLELQQDPLRLLQGLARNRTVIAAWAGEYEGTSLTYAEAAHPERRRYSKPDAVIVPTEEVPYAQTQKAKKELV